MMQIESLDEPIAIERPVENKRWYQKQSNLEYLWVPGAILLGVVVGLVAEIENQDDTVGGRISSILGWTYFCAWSVSFYPQVVLNWRRKSVVGLSLDYQLLNFVGFGFYFAFNALLFWSPHVRDEYQKAHNGHISAVRLNDVVFAGHAFLITSITLMQIYAYYDYPRPSFEERVLRRIVVAGLCIAGGGVCILALVIALEQEKSMNWLTFLTAISQVKVLISVVKYCPQVWMNYRRKSTDGWVIHNVLLDFTGGGLSVAQLLLDASMKDDWSAVSGDPAKLLLGNVSVFFDVIFMIQHFCLYRKDQRECDRLVD